MKTTISEKFSKKRGRPSLWSDEENHMTRMLYGLVTDRTRNNKSHQMNALQALEWKPDYIGEFAWLVEMHAGGSGTFKRGTLLTELGRFGHPDVIREYARMLCRIKPATSKAIVWLRNARKNGKPKRKGDTIELGRSIQNHINEYLDTHDFGETVYADISNALNLVLGTLRS